MYFFVLLIFFFFFFVSETTAIYTLSLHDALPICIVLGTQNAPCAPRGPSPAVPAASASVAAALCLLDRKSTRLNSSHLGISYSVLCLKKKKKNKNKNTRETHHKDNHTRQISKLQQ